MKKSGGIDLGNGRIYAPPGYVCQYIEGKIQYMHSYEHQVVRTLWELENFGFELNNKHQLVHIKITENDDTVKVSNHQPSYPYLSSTNCPPLGFKGLKLFKPFEYNGNWYTSEECIGKSCRNNIGFDIPSTLYQLFDIDKQWRNTLWYNACHMGCSHIGNCIKHNGESFDINDFSLTKLL